MRDFLVACAVTVAINAAADVRPPAVAGAFYPADEEALRTRVSELLDRARDRAEGPTARALVVPHAGYDYSAPTAATAFARLPTTGIRRVILLGPSHHVSFGGGALPAEGVTAFETPLGSMVLDRPAVEELRRNRNFDGPVQAHSAEHALEVELPFLQVVAPTARLVPVVVGSTTDFQTTLDMAEALAALVDDGTVVVASSDFTHHGSRYGWSPYDGPDLPETLLAVGRRTAERAAAMDPRGFLRQIEVSGDTVCGARPVGVLASLLSHAFSGEGRVLEVTTSGHVTDRFDLSVTYVAIAFAGRWTGWQPL